MTLGLALEWRHVLEACMHAAHDVETSLERADERGNPALQDSPTFIGDADQERACAARAGFAAVSRGNPVVTVPPPQESSPMQRSRAQSRRPNAVLAYVGSVTSPRKSR